MMMRIVALILLPLMVVTAAAEPFQHKWTVASTADRLNPKDKSAVAFVEAEETLQQLGRPLRIALNLACTGGGYVASLRFTEPVAISERRIRWRVDERPTRHLQSRFYNDGMTFYLATPYSHAEFIGELRKGKVMKAEADLPWAGNQILTFNIEGADRAMAQMPCAKAASAKKN